MEDRPFAVLAGEPTLARLAAIAEQQGTALHLVGGAVRDLLAGRVPEDLDLAVGGDVEALARAFAEAQPASLVRLDDSPLTIRVVPRGAGRHAAVDLAAYRVPTLEADLRLRDFTVNAMAIPLGPVVAGEPAAVLDPTGGLADLSRRLIRMTGPRAFDDDPLRALRAHRLAATLGFAIERLTARAAAARARRLAEVSAERVAVETFRLLAVRDAASRVGALGRAGLLEPALRLSGPPAAGWRAALERLARILADPDGTLGPAAGAIAQAALDRPLAAGRLRVALLRFALVAGPEGPEAARRLRLAAREVAFLETLRAVRGAVAGLTRAEARDPAWLVRRVVRRAGDDAEAALLHALVATRRAAARHRIAEALAALSVVVRPRLAPPRPLSGDDLVAALGVPPGPAVGRLLGWLDEARAAGLVSDRESALAFCRRRAADACRVEEHPV